MSHIIETRRAFGRKRVSEVVLAGNTSVDTASTDHLQAAFVASRFVVSDALARAVAELAFAKGRLR